MASKYSRGLVLVPLLAVALGVKAAGGQTGSEENYSRASVPEYTFEINNLVIYTISRERRSEDRKQASSILATTVDRILEESGIRGLIINERILNVFKKKISLLQTAFKKVNRLGGKSVRKLLEFWKNGKPYRFKIYHNELEAASLQQENLLLKKGKRELETELVQEQVKRQKVEEQLEEALQKADRKGSFYKKKFRQMASKIAKL